jgi:hypothetical protein
VVSQQHHAGWLTAELNAPRGLTLLLQPENRDKGRGTCHEAGSTTVLQRRFEMKTVAVTFAVLLMTVAPALATDPCPPELAKAREALKAAGATAQAKKPTALAGQRKDVQAPRGQDTQAPRGQDTQAPRGQDTQAPRGQDTQAPRGQDTQAPRGQDTQAPRGQDTQAPRAQAQPHAAAREAIRQAEQACKAGDMTKSAGKAREALTLLEGGRR